MLELNNIIKICKMFRAIKTNKFSPNLRANYSQGQINKPTFSSTHAKTVNSIIKRTGLATLGMSGIGILSCKAVELALPFVGTNIISGICTSTSIALAGYTLAGYGYYRLVSNNFDSTSKKSLGLVACGLGLVSGSSAQLVIRLSEIFIFDPTDLANLQIQNYIFGSETFGFLLGSVFIIYYGYGALTYKIITHLSKPSNLDNEVFRLIYIASSIGLIVPYSLANWIGLVSINYYDNAQLLQELNKTMHITCPYNLSSENQPNQLVEIYNASRINREKYAGQLLLNLFCFPLRLLVDLGMVFRDRKN